MKKKALLIALPVLLLSAVVVPVLAQYSWTFGVNVGDWFLYQGTLISYSGDASFPPMFLEFLQTYNESSWMKYTVTAVGTENVTFSVLTHWKNGTETTSTLEEDTFNSQTMMVLGANLANGTEIRAAYSFFGVDFPAKYITNTTMIGTRQTNLAIFDTDIFGNLFHYTYYWDKTTGIQIYSRSSVDNSVDMYGSTYSYDAKLELIDSSVGVVWPESYTLTVMLLMLTASAVSIVLYRRKKLRI